jgi:hypothetical protein
MILHFVIGLLSLILLLVAFCVLGLIWRAIVGSNEYPGTFRGWFVELFEKGALMVIVLCVLTLVIVAIYQAIAWIGGIIAQGLHGIFIS